MTRIKVQQRHDFQEPQVKDQEVKEEAKEPSKMYEQFLLFGDSITQMGHMQQSGFNFAPALQSEYIRRLDVINRGFSGYNSRQALKITQSVVPPPSACKVQFMSIWFGANDACHPDFVTAQHIPLDHFKFNLMAMIQHPAVQAQTPLRIILITPPPVNEHQLAPVGDDLSFRGRTAKLTRNYAKACIEVSEMYNKDPQYADSGVEVEALDLWSAFMRHAGWDSTTGQDDELPGGLIIPENEKLKELLSDGLHLTSQGYFLVFHEMMQLIRKRWPEQAPENVPMIFPEWTSAPGREL